MKVENTVLIHAFACDWLDKIDPNNSYSNKEQKQMVKLARKNNIKVDKDSIIYSGLEDVAYILDVEADIRMALTIQPFCHYSDYYLDVINRVEAQKLEN